MSESNKTVKVTMTITFIIILSKAVGFIREMVISAQFGQSVQSDAYSTAYGILSIFTVIFSAGISSTFIPIYTKTRIDSGKKGADIYASNILNLYIIAGAVVSVIAYIFAPQLCALIWHGEEGLELIVTLTRLMLPSLAFWAMSGVLINVLDANKHFVPEQLVGFALSGCCIVACFLFKSIEALSIATAITAVVQVLMLIPFAKKDFKYLPRLNIADTSVKRTFILAMPALISMAFDELNHQSDRVFGSMMGIGTVTALRNSYTLVQTALGVLIVPITTVMFSQLSSYVAKNEMVKLKETVRRSIEVIAFVTIPIIIVCMINSVDIIAIFYQRGNFTPADSAFTGPVFACYILGIFAFGLRNFLTRVFYSLQLTKIPMFIGIISVGVNIALDFVFMKPLGAYGLTLATSLASGLSAVLMLVFIRKKLGGIHLNESVKEFIKIAVSAVACFAAAYIIANVVTIDGTGFGASFARFAVSALPALLVYIVMAYATKIKSFRTVGSGFMRKIKKR